MLPLCYIPVAHVKKHLAAPLWEIQLRFCCYMRRHGERLFNYDNYTHTRHCIRKHTCTICWVPWFSCRRIRVRLTSINSILGGYKCTLRLLSISKGGIWRKNSLWQPSYYYSFRKMLILTINKRHPLMQVAFQNKQVIFMSWQGSGLGGMWFTGESAIWNKCADKFHLLRWGRAVCSPLEACPVLRNWQIAQGPSWESLRIRHLVSVTCTTRTCFWRGWWWMQAFPAGNFTERPIILLAREIRWYGRANLMLLNM